MFIIEELKKYNNEKLAIFVDMDGVVADYKFGEGTNIKNNVEGVYLNKRPIKTSIDIIKKINEEISDNVYILSSCYFKEQSDEKNKWLDKNMPFIKNNKRIFVMSNDFDSRKKLKIEYLKQYLNANSDEKIVLIDDTHEILFLAIKEFGDNVIPIHVITLFD